MTATQLSLDNASGLPQAFVDRWRELGGASIAGESCSLERGRHTFAGTVAGVGRFVFIRRADVAACADELFARVCQ